VQEGAGPAIFCFVPLVFTILVHIRLGRQIIGPLQTLSMEVAADVDLQDGALSPIAPADTDEAYALGVDRKLYGQPSLKPSLEERAPRPFRPDPVQTSRSNVATGASSIAFLYADEEAGEVTGDRSSLVEQGGVNQDGEEARDEVPVMCADDGDPNKAGDDV
jgi:hypothetical protein